MRNRANKVKGIEMVKFMKRFSKPKVAANCSNSSLSQIAIKSNIKRGTTVDRKGPPKLAKREQFPTIIDPLSSKGDAKKKVKLIQGDIRGMLVSQNHCLTKSQADIKNEPYTLEKGDFKSNSEEESKGE